jgi:hypothetical protein
VQQDPLALSRAARAVEGAAAADASRRRQRDAVGRQPELCVEGASGRSPGAAVRAAMPKHSQGMHACVCHGMLLPPTAAAAAAATPYRSLCGAATTGAGGDSEIDHN